MRWSFVLPLLALLLAASSVRADDEAEAKAAYARGRNFFKAGRYAEAAVELKKAYSLKPHPALLRYMGDTYYKMNKARLAIKHYKWYLKEAPQAPDKDKIEAKVKQLEMIVGAGEEEGQTPPPSTPQTTAPLPPPTPPPSAKVADAPTGEDREVPLALRRKSMVEQPAVQKPAPKRSVSAMSIAKWTTLGVGAASLVVGIVFNRMAAAKASELEDAVRKDCPIDPATNAPTECGGNPDMNTPKVPYGERHYNLQQSSKLYRQVSLSTLIIGGAMAGASVVLFIVDATRKGGERPSSPPRPRASVAPILGSNTWGLGGEVSF